MTGMPEAGRPDLPAGAVHPCQMSRSSISAFANAAAACAHARTNAWLSDAGGTSGGSRFGTPPSPCGTDGNTASCGSAALPRTCVEPTFSERINKNRPTIRPSPRSATETAARASGLQWRKVKSIRPVFLRRTRRHPEKASPGRQTCRSRSRDSDSMAKPDRSPSRTGSSGDTLQSHIWQSHI